MGREEAPGGIPREALQPQCAKPAVMFSKFYQLAASINPGSAEPYYSGSTLGPAAGQLWKLRSYMEIQSRLIKSTGHASTDHCLKQHLI